MNKISDLLKDKQFLVDLLNGPCPPKHEGGDFDPINPDWIDTVASETATEAFHRLLPKGMPYSTIVLAERNPDTICNGSCVDANEKRMRYFVVSVIPDAVYPYNYSFPLIHMLWTVSLDCWETIRAMLFACEENMRTVIVSEPVPPILNNARLYWASLYVGKAPYAGIRKLSEQWANADEFDGFEGDTHLYKVREMETDPLVQRLIDAYDADYPEEKEDAVHQNPIS